MKKNKKYIISIFICLIALIIIFLFSYKSNKNKPIKIPQIENQATLKTQDFHLQQIFENKNNKWKLKAKSGEIFKEKNKANCYDSKASFVKNNKKIALLKAPKTTFYFKKNKIKMTGGVQSKILNNFS